MRSKITTFLTVLGAVTVLVLAANTAAIAATGKGFLLGKSNSADRLTSLTRTTPGPVLAVKSKNSTAAPLVVNGKGRVTNLNADKVDGKDASVLGTRALVWTYVGNSPQQSGHTYTLANVPAGTYFFNYEVWLGPGSYSGAGDLDCYLTRGTVYGGEAGAPGNGTFGTGLTGSATMTLPATSNVSLVCRVSSGTSSWTFTQTQPLRVTAIPITTLTNKGLPAAKVAARVK
ncbi:MAG TPA: hypothetical protein VNS46_17260 [Nocardioides sp.]|nr:hypothetical protein [Nocardioides sp.]